MFEQTFVGGKTRRPWTSVVAFAIQIGLVALAIMIPLLFIQGLQERELHGILLAPPPPPPPPPPPAPAAVAPKVVKVIPRQFNANELMAPRTIPKKVMEITDPQDVPPPSAGVQGGVPGGVPGGSAGGVVGGVLNSPVGAAPPPPPPPPPKQETPKVVRVGGNVQAAKLTNKVMPQYPPLAKQARIQGTVKLQAMIAKDGSVENLKVVSGHPLLVPAALQAVRQWKYQPTVLNGQPVEVLTEIDVNFTLSS